MWLAIVACAVAVVAMALVCWRLDALLPDPEG